MSNNIPVLMLRGANGKFFPVAGITGGGGGTGSSMTAEKVAYTNENFENVTTVKEALDAIVDAFLACNNTFEYIGSELNKKASLSDITPEATGAKSSFD